MQKINEEIIQVFKNADWQFVIDIGAQLDDLNIHEWRFLKGKIVEKLVILTIPEFTENAVIHKDFDWGKLKIECKSQLSEDFYNKEKNLKNTQSVIKFTNSRGTNTKTTLDPDSICDILMIVKKDGICLMDKSSILKNLDAKGDGFNLHTPIEDLVEISGHLSVVNKYNLNIRDQVVNLTTNLLLECKKSCLKN